MSKYPYKSDIICKNCDGEIFIKRSRDINNIFCGPACVGKFRKKEVLFTSCNFCKKSFRMSNKSKNIFCSIECSNKSKIKEYSRICEYCGKNFIVHNIAEINRGGNRFCSSSCSSRKYYVNESYFDSIDNQNKAYILGFIYADGCLSKKNELIIKLHHKDNDILEKIKKDMDSENNIFDIIQKDRDLQRCFRINSKRIIDSLKDIGLTTNKTFTIEFPDLDKEFIRHFIRGYFDGDGCISKRKNSNSYNIVIFTASEEFKSSLVNIIEQMTKIKLGVSERNNGYAIYFNKKKFINIFYEFLYTDCEMFLDRKRNKFPKN